MANDRLLVLLGLSFENPEEVIRLVLKDAEKRGGKAAAMTLFERPEEYGRWFGPGSLADVDEITAAVSAVIQTRERLTAEARETIHANRREGA